MKNLLSILLLVTSLFSLELANIDFNTASWTFDAGATLTGDTLTITGDKSKYIKARLTVNVPSTTTDLYFTGDVWMTEIDGGPESYKTAKFKILNGNTSLQAFNMPDLLIQKWYTTGMRIQRFDKQNITSVTLEFSIQNADGTMKILNPMLTDSAPEASYSFPFDIPSYPTCHILIETGNTRPFPTHLLSTNSHFVWASGSWGDDAVQSVIKNRLPLGNLRFPGGTVGNFYDWSTDGFYGDEWTFMSPSRKQAYENGFRFGYSDFATLCNETNATATLMFNVIQDDVNKAASRLQNRINSGIDIDWIEMGNENFFTEQAYGNVDTPEKYLNHTKSLNTALKQIDSTVKTAVNIDHHDWGVGSWNDNLAKENYYDAAVMHPYVQTQTFMMNAYAARIMLSSFQITRKRLAEYRSMFGSTPLLCTEFGVLSEGAPDNFMQVLGMADLFLALLEGNDSGTVQQLGLHMFYHSDRYSNSTCYYKDNGEMKLTELGVVYEALVNFFTGAELYNGSGFSIDLDNDLPAVVARAVQRGDSTQILVVNKLPVASPLQIAIDSSTFLGNFNMKWYSDSILSDGIGIPFGSDPWHYSSGVGTPSIPPYSIAIVTINEEIALIEEGLQKSINTISIKPIKDAFLVQLDKPAEIQILAINGRAVQKYQNFTKGIVGRSLSKGVYFLKVKTKNRSKIKKLYIN